MNADPPRPTAPSLSFSFEWSPLGLRILSAPRPLEFYTSGMDLQRSIRQGAGPPPPGQDPPAPDLVPFGTLANILWQTGWSRLSLVFEPGPDRLLRVYFSAEGLSLADRSEPVQVLLSARGRPLPAATMPGGRYQSPPLSPGSYIFSLTQGERVLSRVTLALSNR